MFICNFFQSDKKTSQRIIKLLMDLKECNLYDNDSTKERKANGFGAKICY